MKRQTSKRKRKQKRPRFLGSKIPPSSKRFCMNCEKDREFKYNRIVGHSECSFCGSRFAKREK